MAVLQKEFITCIYNQSKMKRIEAIIIALLSVVSWSCEKSPVPSSEASSEIVKDNHSNYEAIPKVITYDGINTLHFESTEELNQFVELITNSNNPSLIIPIKSYYDEFISVERVIYNAIENAPNQDILDRELTSIKQNSANVALFSTDKSDVYPYLKAKSFTISRLANVRGQYFVADSLITIDEFRDYGDLMSSGKVKVYDFQLKEDSSQLRTNNAFAKTRNRKVRFEVFDDSALGTGKVHRIGYRISAQKKYWLYWQRYRTDIFAELYLTPNKVLSVNNEHFSLFMDAGNSKVDKKFVLDTNTQSHLWFGQEDVALDYGILGIFQLETDPSKEMYGKSSTLTGKMTVWSRGTGREGSASDDISIEIE